MHRIGMFVALAAMLPMTSLAQSQSEMEDIAAISYAERNLVSIDEAKKRLKIQDAIKDEDKLGLRSEFEQRLAGMYLAHQPDQHMVVRLVGSSPVRPRVIRTDEGDLRVVFHVNQKHTLAELESIVVKFSDELRSIPGVQGFGVDQKTGEIVLDVAAPDSEKPIYEKKKEGLENELGAPIRFRISQSPQVNLSYVRGGARLDSSGFQCTTGFAVKHMTTGATGVVTAGHCQGPQYYMNWYPPDDPNFVGFPLAFQEELWDASHDMQWHTAPGHSPLGEIFGISWYSGTAITSRKSRATTDIGQEVCHRGTNTGFSCGVVAMTTFVPSGANTCGPYVCSNTWVKVEGPKLACAAGDSGGPVFKFSIAYGIVSSAAYTGNLPGQCGNITYMSVDYLKDLGLTLR